MTAPTDGSAPNYFVLLDLDPDAPWNDSDFEATLTAKQHEWSRDRDHPTRKLEATRSLGMIPEIRRALLDPAERQEQARVAREQRALARRQQTEELERQLRLLGGKGFLLQAELNRLLRDFGPALSEGAVRRAVTVPVYEAAPGAAAEPDMLDPARAKRIQEVLDFLGLENLYEFLLLPQDARHEVLLKQARAAYESTQQYATKTAQITAQAEAAGFAMDIFASDELRARYDATIRAGPLEQLLRQAALAATATRRLTLAQVETLLEEARRFGLSSEVATEALRARAAREGWAIELPAAPAPPPGRSAGAAAPAAAPAAATARPPGPGATAGAGGTPTGHGAPPAQRRGLGRWLIGGVAAAAVVVLGAAMCLAGGSGDDDSGRVPVSTVVSGPAQAQAAGLGASLSPAASASPRAATPSPTPTPPPTPTPTPTPTERPVSRPTWIVNTAPVGCHEAANPDSPIVEQRAVGAVQAVDREIRQPDGLWQREVAQQCWTRTEPGPVRSFASLDDAELEASGLLPPQRLSAALTMRRERATNAKSGQGILRLTFARVNSVIGGQYVEVYAVKKDVRGQTVPGDRVARGETDNTGAVNFDLPPGEYIAAADLPGYNWGNYTQGEGQADVPVRAGQRTTLAITLGRINITIAGVDRAWSGHYFEAYTQKKDINGNTIRADRVARGDTSNTGELAFDLVPGLYAVTSDVRGYNWGDLPDAKGSRDISVEAGQVTPLDLRPGQLVVNLRNANGSVATGSFLELYTQKTDANGRVVTADRVASGDTDNTGVWRADVVSGLYTLRIGSREIQNIRVNRGQVTATNQTR